MWDFLPVLRWHFCRSVMILRLTWGEECWSFTPPPSSSAVLQCAAVCHWGEVDQCYQWQGNPWSTDTHTSMKTDINKNMSRRWLIVEQITFPCTLSTLQQNKSVSPIVGLFLNYWFIQKWHYKIKCDVRIAILFFEFHQAEIKVHVYGSGSWIWRVPKWHWKQ